MKLYRIYGILFLIVSAMATVGQSSKTDSLLKRIAVTPDDTNKVRLYKNIGNSVAYQTPKEAIAYWMEGVRLANKLNYKQGLADCYMNISTGYSFLSMQDSSLLYIDTAIKYIEAIGDPNDLALIYHNRGDIYVQLRDFTRAMQDCKVAIKYAEQAGNKDHLGRIYFNIGAMYEYQHQYTAALDNINKALEFFTTTNNVQMSGLSFNNMASIYRDLKKTDKAISYYKKAITIADSLNDYNNLASYYISLCEVYINLNKLDEVEALAASAMENAKKGQVKSQQGYAWCLYSIVYNKLHKPSQAISAGLSGYALAQESAYIPLQQASAEVLADAYKLAGKNDKAYDYLKISKDLNDSLAVQKFNTETASLQTAFEVDRKNKEIELLGKDGQLQQQQLKQQRLLLVAAAILAFLLLVGIGLLISRNRLRQRMKELELRNRIAADLHDEVGSSLSSIHMLSQVAAQQSPQDNSHVDILNRVSNNARETMEKMGDIVWMIKPGENEGQSLWQRMERFMYEMCSSQNITCTSEGTEVLENVKLSMQQRKNFYLIFKEALNNAVKYSGTDKVFVRISQQNHQLQLSVQDYGKGFTLNGEGGHTGNGLSNMRNRAKELGGQLSIEAAAGKGTSVLLSFPV
jgi:two-component system sensor histidine kinase UhpB